MNGASIDKLNQGETSEWFGGDGRAALARAPMLVAFSLIGFAFLYLFLEWLNPSEARWKLMLSMTLGIAVSMVQIASGCVGAAKKRYRFDANGITIAGAFMTKHIPWDNVRRIEIRRLKGGEIGQVIIRSEADFFSPRRVTSHWDLDGIVAAIFATKADVVIVE
jgi:hypothetical protein